MATGASTADLAILLVDARHGVREQTRTARAHRTLLGIRHFVLAVNKMDLLGFDRGVFEAIVADFDALLPDASRHAIPMSALEGDNVIATSARTPWFDGPGPAALSRDGRRRAPPMPPGPSGSPCSSCSGRTRTSAATPGRSRRAASRVGDPRHGLALRPRRAHRPHRDLRRRPARGLRADVGLARARRRSRRQPRRRARRRQHAGRQPHRGRRGLDGRAAARSRAACISSSTTPARRPRR